ncbi:histone-lysine N-methyltransferase 2A [Danio rerio]|uniref:Histone-lysine N-methyltransferase n=1 Tax=Danio rerio TaxID=7955 RepID=A8VKP8_DANRE|nr:histone-lysine N-methyltransferase 2A [Danio rerio]ABW79914.1 myeloid/lymphoid or mixed-lineage leukemia [Danio rerio]|eukprot:NP_001103749.1 histone-lysine N-methyltransferase 2A [Danio rerio]
MAHSCRWRFPARPGGSSSSGTGRKAGRIRVNASLLISAGTNPNANGLGPGFDAALQVSAAIGSNLQKFRDVLGESSGSSSGEEEFGGFTTVSDNRRLHSPGRTSIGSITPDKKPRGRPPRTPAVQRVGTDTETAPLPVATSPTEKLKRQPGRPPGTREKKRGHPPASVSQRTWQHSGHALPEEGREVPQECSSSPVHSKEGVEENKEKRQTPLGSGHHQGSEAKLHKVSRESKVTKLKRLREVKLSPLKSKLKAIVRKTVTVPGKQRRKRGRPPSAERLKAEAAAAAAAAQAANASMAQETSTTAPRTAKKKAFRVRRSQDLGARTPHELRASHTADEHTHSDSQDSPTAADPLTPTKVGRPLGLRQSPRHIKPVRVVPPSKRTDATIAKQLLQRAKKGAQKKKLLEKDSVGTQGKAGLEAGKHRRRTQLTNIRQFIMPVVSTVSLRIIKTPKRFIEDEGSFSTPPPHMKIARLESALTAPAPQPATPSTPALVSTAPSTSGTTATPGSGSAVESLPPPPPPVSTGSTTAIAASLLNSSCNNSTSNGRFSSSAAPCGSSAVSQHSSQPSSGESSRSTSPSLDDSSCDSQASEGTQALSEEADHSPASQGETEASLHHASHPPSPTSEPEPDHIVLEHSRRGRRGQSHRRGAVVARGRGNLIIGRKQAIISPATGVSQAGSQQASSTASSSSSPPPPPLLSPPQPPQTASSNAAEHHSHSPWMMSHSIAPFLPTSSILSSSHDKRRSILREPTFRWTSLSCAENKYFSSAKYAKEGLIRKPTFDNFRPPPLTAEDVGLTPPVTGGGGVTSGGFPAPGGAAGTGTRLFSPLHHHPHHNHHQHSSSRFETPLQKRTPLLRPPFFTPSPAHSRIFESVTLPSSSGSSPGSLSPLQVSPSSSKKEKGSRFSRGQPRSPSHSMITRSSQSGVPTGKSSEQSIISSSVPITVTGNSSPLPGVAVSPLAASALTQTSFSGFPSGSIGLTSHGVSDGRRAAGGLSVSGNSASSSQLSPLFTPSPQASGGGTGKAGKERGISATRDTGTKEKDREMEKSREREKENKRDGRRDWDKRGKSLPSEASPSSISSFFGLEAIEESLTQKRTPGRKKSVTVDCAEASPSDSAAVQAVGSLSSKGRLTKKGRPPEKSIESEGVEREKDKEKLSALTQAGQMGKPPTTTSIDSILDRAEKQPVTDRRVVRLLKKAKAQLNKIEKRELQPGDQPKLPGQESDSSETSVRGPRIKHVCRRAAVALGRNRAVFPDDMPTLSALPWEEREKILSSMGNDDKSSVAGSGEAEPPTPPIKPVTRQKTVHEAPPRKGRRSRRCGQCPGCQVPNDCGVCTNCLDKPKFGGRNIKKQCCKVRKCQNLQWMPSKFLQKQAKGKKDRRRNKLSEKKELHHKSQCSEASPKSVPPPKDEPPRKKSETPPPAQGDDKQKQTQPSSPSSPASSPKDPLLSSPPDDHKHSLTSLSSACRKERKQQPSSSPTFLHAAPSSPPAQSQHSLQQPCQMPAKKEGLTKSQSHTEPKKKSQQQSQPSSATDTAPDAKLKKQTTRCVQPLKPKPKEKEKQLPKPDSSTLNSQSTPSTGGTAKQKAPYDGVHRIRVDFKEDYNIENVWEMGGLSILTSVPITPRVVCFLCASSGNVEFVFCQVRCEPFHLFCLGEAERPHDEQWENWCCRRCRFCHVCGRKYQKTKQLLECDKCRNSYHPECLGPNHPTRPTKKKRVWVCTKCVRCKSCGATKPGKAWDAQWSHDFSLCHDCAKRLTKGNLCPLCNKGYDDDDCDSKMMKCKKCDRWVHAKCESLTDDMCELMSSLPENVVYTCTNCTESHPAEWRTVLEKEIQRSMRQVLTALFNSRTSTHLLRYRQAVMKPPELNPETEESLPSRRSPEGPDPPVLTEVSPPNDSPLDLESVEKKMDSGCYKSVLEFSDDIVKIIQTAFNSDGGQLESRKANSMLKSFFIRQMERIFPWYKVKESKFWETSKASSNSGLPPNVVLPPSLDHNYAQCQEREEIAKAGQSVHMKKIIPAPHPKAPGEPNSLMAPTPPPPPPMLIHDHSLEDSPVIPPPPGVGDNRQCALCLNYGDEKTNDCGRLLYIGHNEWAHVNCALWSAEVYEDVDGALKNVHMAVSRGKQLQCKNCHKPGATVSCCMTSCTNNYHFMCARQQQCAFLEDKKVYCQHHKDLVKGEVVPESSFEVTRRVLVDFEGIRLRRKFVNGLEPDNIHMVIGSMTIDCLGMLTELSDCERKLFPVGYQCSRVYWSTLDARKRCVYKCRILVCRPPLSETLNKNIAAQEENHTVVHSPPPVSVDTFLPGPIDSTKPSNVPSTPKPRVYFRNRHPSFPPCHRSPSTRPLPSPDGFNNTGHEIVTVGDPLLSSSLRSIGSRRHSTSSISAQQPRQKVSSPPQGGTVYSQTGNSSASFMSSTSKEPLTKDTDKGRVSSGETSFSREPNSINIGAQRRLSFGFTERVDGSKEATKKHSDGESLKSSQPASVSQVSPPLGTAVLTGHQRASGGIKNEKGKQATKDNDLPAGATFMSSHPLAMLPKDKANPNKEGNMTSMAALKDTVKTGSPQRIYNKSGSRKPHDYASGPAAVVAMKPLWSSGAKLGEEDIKRGFQASAGITGSHGTSSTKEKHSKVKMNVSRDVSKERKETPQNRNAVLNSNSKSSNVKTQGQVPPPHNISNKATALSSNTGSGTVEVNKFDQKEVEKPLKSKERFSFEKKHTSAMDAIQPKAGSERSIRPPQVHPKSSKEVPLVGKKHTERLSLMSQKMDPNRTKAVSISPNTQTYTSVTPSNQGPQRRSSRAMVFSPSASSESSESDSHIHPDDSEEHLMDHQCADDGEDNNLEDEGSVDKHHEEDSDGSAGSAKRRYPRRSARARSNMFFGLTPFYGVRSYGEEDIPFYRSGEISMKKRTGSSKRSAEGQVDGADDMSTSSSADSGEDEEGGIGSNKDTYYYNFTRTIINPSSGLPSIAGIDQCLGRGSQIHRFLRDQAKEHEDDSDEVSTATKNLELQQIGQLDGVDDGSESDISISTSSTTTATTSSTQKGSTKRKGRESRTEKSNVDSGKEAVNTTSNSRDSRKNQKDNCLPLGSVKTQGQDPLETQLSLTTDLLKSDSDNNNSDDCGNILPSDIMEFVLNTPSMQALGQQAEAPSAEQFSLDESYGVDVNQRKDMLFEDFTQPLANAESGESGVSTTIAVEESYGLPPELPSDLSVLTTRSPTVSNQNHGPLISETSERTMLALATEESEAGKGKKKTRTGSTVSSKSPQEGCADSQVPEGHMTPEHFIPPSVDGDHITSPGVAPVGETGNQDMTRTSSTPVLPSSPTLPLQNQKFIPATTVTSGPAPITSSAVQAAASQLKPGPEKLIVLNQHLQPLYVLQTVPNGVMNPNAPVLTGLSGGISTSQSIFPAGSKGLVPVSHHPQIHAFTGTTQTGFQPVIPSTTSGLLIGVTSHDPQIGVTEAGHRHDHAPNVAMVSSASTITPAPSMIPSGHGKKRLISRLQSPKSKKQARPKTQPTLAPSDVGPNMTLINLSPSQIAAGIPAQTGLTELGTITATPHRKIPNIIKRPKQGVMYLEPTILPQPMPISTTTQPGILGHDSSTHLLPCTVSGLNTSQSVLNVVSVLSSAPGNFLGGSSVSLSAPGLISSTEITGSLSNLLIKANPHNLSLSEQPMVLRPGTPMMSHLTNPAQTSIASSICVFPPNQSITVPVNQQVEKEGTVHLQHAVSRVLADKTLDPNVSSAGQVALAPNPISQELNKGHVVSVLTQSSGTSPISRPQHQHQASKLPAGASSVAFGKGKHKAKRPRPCPDKSSGKKHKGLHSDTPTVDTSAIQLSYIKGDQELSSPEPMDTGQSNETGSKKRDSTTMTTNSSALKRKTVDAVDEKPSTAGLPSKGDGTGNKAFSVDTPDQRDSGRDSSLDHKPKKGLIFEICSDDGFQIRCESIEEARKSLTDKVQEARSNARLKALSFDGVNGLKMLGVVHDAVVFLLEQLYGARHCRNYRFRFHKPEETDYLPVNPHGSARAEVYHRKSVLDMFNFLASKHRQPPVYNPQEEDEEEMQQKSARRATSTDLPLPEKFRQLKKASRDAVGVYRSAIHGRGLFCRKNIEPGEMVIEYSGNVIRSVLTDKREKYYDDKGIGCYMFRIDDYEVVDATIHGNSARFINHSCEPNCYSRVVNVDGQKHIVIFATRKIYKGEELTYDYKFPIEEPGNKLPCNCGAKKCRKFLN